MKKSLLALAAMGAFAGAAHAQSSVTVYGILDTGVVSTKADTFGGTAVTQSAVTGGGVSSTSRLGFRGREDLGGGVAAEFVLESALLNASTSAASSASPLFSTSGTSGARQAFVALSSKSLGTASIGYQYTFTHTTALQGDPFGGLNLPGQPLVAVTLTGMAASAAVMNNATAVQPGGSTGATTGATGTNADYASRSSAVIYTLPTMAGLTARVSYSLNGGESIAANGISTPSRNDALGAMLNYTIGKFGATASYVAAVQATTAYGINASTDDRRINNTRITANYDFGMIRAYATYGLDTIAHTADAAAGNGQKDVRNQSTQVAVLVPVGSNVNFRASYSTGKYTLGTTAGGASYGVERNQVGMQVGANYLLSKRTDLYAAYGQFSRQNTTAAADNKDTGFALGVRHTF